MMEIGHNDEIPVSRVNTTAHLVSSIALLVIGAIGNILLLTSVLVVKKLRTIHNVFIFNLVMADCASLILLEVLSIASFAYGESPLANDTRLCKVVSFFCLSADIGSVWSAASCALHLYVRVCHKAIFNVIYTPQIVTVMIFWLWSLCPMIIIPSMMGWGSHRFDSRLMHCTYDSSASSSFTYFMLTTGVWIPLATTIYCLVRIITYLHNQPPEPEARVHEIRVSLEDEPSTHHFTSQIFTLDPPREALHRLHRPPPPLRITPQENAITMRSVIAMSLIMIIAWMTMSVLWIRGAQTSLGDAQYIFGMVLAHSPSCMNSIIYAMVNKDFRDAYMYLLKFRRRNAEQVQADQENQQHLDNALLGLGSHPASPTSKVLLVLTLPSHSVSNTVHASHASYDASDHHHSNPLNRFIGSLRQHAMTEVD